MFGWKTYSAKTKAAANDWLKQFDETLDNLTEAQQEEVIRHTQKRRIIKWYWLSVLSGLLYLCAGIYSFFLVDEIIRFHFEYIADAGKAVRESEMLGIVKFNLCAMTAMPLVCLLIALFIFCTTGAEIYRTMQNEKTLKAFLNDRSAGKEVL